MNSYRKPAMKKLLLVLAVLALPCTTPSAAEPAKAPINLDIGTPPVVVVKHALAQRTSRLVRFYEAGEIGLGHDGFILLREGSKMKLVKQQIAEKLIDAENQERKALVQALEDADGVLSTFNAVLAIARLQAAGEAPDQTHFDPGRLAADIAELYEPLCEDKGLDFKAELTPQLTVKAARPILTQALANIIDNAIKYTPPGGAVMLRVRRRSSGEIEFSVTDTGPGVPEEHRARVVQRFVRLENSRSEPGSGLGLSLVAAVAEAHGGRLELDEGPGEYNGSGPGLRVALVLPRVE